MEKNEIFLTFCNNFIQNVCKMNVSTNDMLTIIADTFKLYNFEQISINFHIEMRNFPK